ncbi:hypothetical protein AVEN_234927-1 [Araneus ventricosus]|uniref:HTH CENPB-type domain-containing protein n=1 Tax=Araneus ventricosus TaxID=182803 RepID=A0A4Y2JUU1_ARAVE|nr:hypothetical protein AVEN_234927-1 [Araneus ventricosus]
MAQPRGKTDNEEINEIVWEWFVDARRFRNLPITEPVLQVQAKDIAEKLIFMHQMDGLEVSEKDMGYLSKRSVVKLGTFRMRL